MMDRKALSNLRQEIVNLREDREKLENSLFRPKKMIRASLVFLANYCGKKDCRCKKGFPHGPYPYLSEKRDGRTRMTYVQKGSLEGIKAEAEEYARFQHRLARLRKTNEKIRSLLENIRDIDCREVDDYRKETGRKK
ncbi:MAG: hypothetical protein GH144_07100 [Clostridia bacterium]|jgi:hypothetical protein|nr:hypothetical protein [Clostridia bacterium]